MSASKVSLLDHIHLTHVYRFGLDVATLMMGSMYPMESFGVIWRWLCKLDMSAVSDFVFSHLIDADALDFQSSVFVPRVPQHPGPEGKSCQCSDILFRSLPQSDHVNAS